MTFVYFFSDSGINSDVVIDFTLKITASSSTLFLPFQPFQSFPPHSEDGGGGKVSFTSHLIVHGLLVLATTTAYGPFNTSNDLKSSVLTPTTYHVQNADTNTTGRIMITRACLNVKCNYYGHRVLLQQVRCE